MYNIQEDIIKEINNLKLENENLKKELESIKNINKNEIIDENNNELIDVKLINGASNYQSGYRDFKVYKMKNNNIVKLSGLINCAFGKNICNLPENCRPKGQLIFIGMSNNDTPKRIDVYANGNIYPSGSGSGWLSLDNISFIAEI